MSSVYRSYIEDMKGYVSNLSRKYGKYLGNERGSASFSFAFAEPTHESALAAYNAAMSLWRQVVSNITRYNSAPAKNHKKKYYKFEPIVGSDGSFAYRNMDNEDWEEISFVRHDNGSVAMQGYSESEDLLEMVTGRSKLGHVIKELSRDSNMFKD